MKSACEGEMRRREDEENERAWGSSPQTREVASRARSSVDET